MTPIPERFRPILQAAAAGDLPPRIAFMRLAMEATDPAELQSVLDRAVGAGENNAHLLQLRTVAAENPEGWHMVKSVLAAVAHDLQASADPAERLRTVAAMFDRAATISPEASVALYSLGDAAELAHSANEVSDYLVAQGVVGPNRRVLEIGCGIGRFLVSLAPRVQEIVGLDLSPVMIAEAQRRITALPNAEARITSGLNLSEFKNETFDTVLAIDSFPYVIDAGGALPRTMFTEASRVLRPGGDLVICNFSYRGDPDRDRHDAETLGHAAGLELRLAGERPFRLWDGTVFRLGKA